MAALYLPPGSLEFFVELGFANMLEVTKIQLIGTYFFRVNALSSPGSPLLAFWESRFVLCLSHHTVPAVAAF